MKVTVTENNEDKPLKLEVGKTYLNRDGEKVLIVHFNRRKAKPGYRPFLDENGNFFSENGSIHGDGPESLCDLIKEVPEEPAQQEIKYPCLMIDVEGNITLFINKFTGFYIVNGLNNDHTDIGYYSEDWKMEYFKPFTGKITLENE